MIKPIYSLIIKRHMTTKHNKQTHCVARINTFIVMIQNKLLWSNPRLRYCNNHLSVTWSNGHGLSNYVMFHAWASSQIRKIVGCACAGNAGNSFPPPWFSDPEMHHGTCVRHVPWCMPGSLTSGFLWRRWRGKRSRHSRRMRKPQFSW